MNTGIDKVEGILFNYTRKPMTDENDVEILLHYDIHNVSVMLYMSSASLSRLVIKASAM